MFTFRQRTQNVLDWMWYTTRPGGPWVDSTASLLHLLHRQVFYDTISCEKMRSEHSVLIQKRKVRVIGGPQAERRISVCTTVVDRSDETATLVSLSSFDILKVAVHFTDIPKILDLTHNLAGRSVTASQMTDTNFSALEGTMYVLVVPSVLSLAVHHRTS